MSSGTNFLGYFNSIDEVLATYPNGGNEGDYLYIGSVVHNWNKYDMIWDAENYTETAEKELHSFEGEVDMHDDLHVGGSTVINGDLRVNGRIYGVRNTVPLTWDLCKYLPYTG